MAPRASLLVEISPRPRAEGATLRTRIRALAGCPVRTRSAEVALAGALVVAVLPAVLPKLVDLLNSWMALRKGRSVRVKVSRGATAIEVEFAPGERRGEEILDFVDRLEARVREAKKRKEKTRKRKGPGI